MVFPYAGRIRWMELEMAVTNSEPRQSQREGGAVFFVLQIAHIAIPCFQA